MSMEPCYRGWGETSIVLTALLFVVSWSAIEIPVHISLSLSSLRFPRVGLPWSLPSLGRWSDVGVFHSMELCLKGSLARPSRWEIHRGQGHQHKWHHSAPRSDRRWCVISGMNIIPTPRFNLHTNLSTVEERENNDNYSCTRYCIRRSNNYFI